jgi:radical SAM protein with 4Fe4S-binding SPASM domain
MLQLKEVKGQIVAGQATTTFDFFIQWHLTERCNLSCRHCYQGRKKPAEMDAHDVKREIDGAAGMLQAWAREYGISLSPSIHFTGGEPFLYDGLWDVAAHAGQMGFRVAVLTNGTLVTAADAARSKNLNVKDVQVSLEGPPDVHDGIRGRGSFAAAMAGARLLIEAGNPVSANMTLTRANIGRMEETAEIAKEAGFSGIGFSRLVPCGRGKGMADVMLTPREIETAYGKLTGMSRAAFECASGDPLAHIAGQDRNIAGDGQALSGCSAGVLGITVTSDGSVMPCRRIGIKIGNLRRTTLRRIWSSSKVLRQLRERENYKGKCGHCPLWTSCRGCRAIAFAYSASCGTPDLFADDPQCWFTYKDDAAE